MPQTPRAQIPYPSLGDPADVPHDLQQMASRIDQVVVLDNQGPLSNRPVAGVAGRLYTDTASGITYRDNGSAWIAFQVTGSADAPPSVPSLRTLGEGAQQAAAGNDPRFAGIGTVADNFVTYSKINTQLKPSAGAPGSQEALRALGTAAGMAAPGSHASQHGAGGADPIVITRAMLPQVPVVTVLPATGTDGQEVDLFFEAGNNGTGIWRFKWVTNADTPKWVFVGGPPLMAWNNNEIGNFSSTSYDFSGNHQLTVPCKGSFIVEHGFAGFSNSGGSHQQLMSLSIPGAVGMSTQGEKDAYAARMTAGNGNEVFSVARSSVVVTTAVGTWFAGMRASGGLWSHYHRWLKVTPMRCS